MRVIIEESYEGEIDSLSPSEAAQKIEDAAHAAAYAIAKAHTAEFPEDGGLDALEELTERLARAYEERMTLMVKDITKAVANGDDTPLGKSHHEESDDESDDGWTMTTTADVLMRAFSGADRQ